MTRKLTVIEKRAKEFIENRLIGDTSFTLTIEWNKSKTWGRTPVVRNYKQEVIARVSGCGFCKESTILADVLCFLFPEDNPAHNKILSLGGCGVGTLQTELGQYGFELTEIRVSVYNVSRKVRS